jgi:hypothetical protein
MAAGWTLCRLEEMVRVKVSKSPPSRSMSATAIVTNFDRRRGPTSDDETHVCEYDHDPPNQSSGTYQESGPNIEGKCRPEE